MKAIKLLIELIDLGKVQGVRYVENYDGYNNYLEQDGLSPIEFVVEKNDGRIKSSDTVMVTDFQLNTKANIVLYNENSDDRIFFYLVK